MHMRAKCPAQTAFNSHLAGHIPQQLDDGVRLRMRLMTSEARTCTSLLQPLCPSVAWHPRKDTQQPQQCPSQTDSSAQTKKQGIPDTHTLQP